MAKEKRAALAEVERLDQLVAYLRDEMDWPIDPSSFEEVEELFFDFTPEELGIDKGNAAKIQEIKRLRPLSVHQPWGEVFFIKFEPKRLPVVALRRILSRVAIKKRASARSDERRAWSVDDLLFISSYGETEMRQISFAHFSSGESSDALPTLKVLGWDNRDTALHLDSVAELLTGRLAWPDDEDDVESWRQSWRSAFVLRHREVVTTSQMLSVELAKLAQAIRDRIYTVLTIETEDGPVTQLMSDFKAALVHDLDAFEFSDMYAQTIAYGLLSARVASPERSGSASSEVPIPVSNPFLRELLDTFLEVGEGGSENASRVDFDELGVRDVVELLDSANMEAVLRDFGDRNPQEDPVIHFYELFLKEYDPDRRMQRGVFYTPRPIVSFIVRSVHELLITEFGLPLGLADTATWSEVRERKPGLKIPPNARPDQPFVQVLDPAVGTGTFLVEAIDVIYRSLSEAWAGEGCSPDEIDDQWNEYVPTQLLPRLHGYELMMAPYAIAHMKVGLKLFETGYRFESDERTRIYLTNSLEPTHDSTDQLEFAVPALAHEAEAVNRIKGRHPFSVVIGNPPYSGVSANMGDWAEALVKGDLPGMGIDDSYYHLEGEPLGERKLWLQDDYVKFIRLSQWLLDNTGCGVHGYISNHGYIDNPTFRGMRYSLAQSFDKLFLLDLHGNYKRQESTPDGHKDENVFDIQQGVAIGVFVKGPLGESKPDGGAVFHADLWGDRQDKYQRLSHGTIDGAGFEELIPSLPLYLFEPFEAPEHDEYYRWMSITDIMPVNVSGVVTARDHFVIDLDKRALLRRIRTFLDDDLSDSEVQERLRLKENYAWRVSEARDDLQAACEGRKLAKFVMPISYRPFDIRYIFWHPAVVWRQRTTAMPHMLAGENVAIVTSRQQARADQPWSLAGVSERVIESCVISNITREINYAFPLFLYPSVGDRAEQLFAEHELDGQGRAANLSPEFVDAVEEATGLQYGPDQNAVSTDEFGPVDILNYLYAVLHAPSYRLVFDEALKRDFPRLPVPATRELFGSLAKFGGELVRLHLLRGTDQSDRLPDLIGSGEFRVERAVFDDGAVYIDKDRMRGFDGVTKAVWDYRMGAYQICHKWLKDRQAKGGKNPTAGRVLGEDEIEHYRQIVAAVSETIDVQRNIDSELRDRGGVASCVQPAVALADSVSNQLLTGLGVPRIGL